MNSNCYGFMVDDSREAWSKLLSDSTMCLSTGGGLGVNYSKVRGRGMPIKTLGGEASGPTALMQMVNEVARKIAEIKQIDCDEIVKITTENAKKLFNLVF
jgi:ribonucleoside-diphosphate reductase alpha chain